MKIDFRIILGQLGDATSCLLRTNGAVRCFGQGTSGQLGHNAAVNSSTSVAVSGMGSGVTAISAGTDHVCGIKAGAARCWGANASGQLGINSTATKITSIAVTGLTSGVAAITTGPTARSPAPAPEPSTPSATTPQA